VCATKSFMLFLSLPFDKTPLFPIPHQHCSRHVASGYRAGFSRRKITLRTRGETFVQIPPDFD
jgi:hypothetical protein